MEAYTGKKELPEEDQDRNTDVWVQAVREKKESPGSFQLAGPVTEAINLAAVSLRAGKMVEYDSKNMRITNDEEANRYLTREYRKGGSWGEVLRSPFSVLGMPAPRTGNGEPGTSILPKGLISVFTNRKP